MQYREEEEEEFTDDDEEGFTNDGSDDDEEGFTDDDEEGFTDDDEDGFTDDEEEGFLSNLFEGFKSKKPNKAARAKIRAKARDKRIKTRNRAVRKREAKRWKKRGQSISRGFKKFDKKYGISKTAKKYVDPVMARALTNAQIIAKNAQKQMEINNISLGNAQKHMANMKSSIMKQVSNVDAKDFKKISLPKKSSSLVFLGFVLVATMIVFALYYMKYSAGHIADIVADKFTSSSIFMTVAIIAIILAVISFLLVVFKGAVMKTDIKQKNVLSIVTSVVTIGLPIMAITLMTIENLPLMMRSFENTFGFSWIGGNKLKELTQKIFGGNGNYNDYSIISTQLFEENFKYYLTCMKKDAPVDPNINLNRFKNVFVDNSYFDEKGKIKMRMPDKEKPDDKVQDLYDLLTMVVRKRHISVATWVSLGTIVTMYTSYLFL
jgi:hypothetical protein